MDEQKIIINNVNVSECEFFEECEIKIDDSECLAHSRHFYEGTFYDCCDEHPDCYYKQLKRKEQECEELKEQFKLAEPLYQSCNIKDKKIKKYEQTLAYIKEIAEKEVKRAPDGETFARPEIKKILQKINEVFNGTNP